MSHPQQSAMTPEQKKEYYAKKTDGVYKHAREIVEAIHCPDYGMYRETEAFWDFYEMLIRHLNEYANGKLEEANKIAEGWPCYHNLGACGPSIAENIRSLKEPLK